MTVSIVTGQTAAALPDSALAASLPSSALAAALPDSALAARERSLAQIASELTATERDCLAAAATGRLARVFNGWAVRGTGRCFALDTVSNLMAAKLARISARPGYPVLALTMTGRQVAATLPRKGKAA